MLLMLKNVSMEIFQKLHNHAFLKILLFIAISFHSPMSFNLHSMVGYRSIKLQRCEYVSVQIEGGPAKSTKILQNNSSFLVFSHSQVGSSVRDSIR